jgi:hypothetical protein
VPVDFGDAQVSVPANWRVGYDAGCVTPEPPGTLYVGSSGYDHCPETGTPGPPVVLLEPLPGPSSSPATGAPRREINGIDVWVEMERDGYGIFEVPELGVNVVVRGRQGLPVLKTLTRSPATVVLAHGRAPNVPGSWMRVTGGDVSFAVPPTWTTSGPIDENCGFDPSIYEPDSVVIEPGGPAAAASCSLAEPLRPPVPPADGVVVNLRPATSPGLPAARIVRSACLHLHGVVACPYERTATPGNDAIAERDILYVQITRPGHPYELLEIGLAGDGTVARAILYSLRPA